MRMQSAAIDALQCMAVVGGSMRLSRAPSDAKPAEGDACLLAKEVSEPPANKEEARPHKCR